MTDRPNDSRHSGEISRLARDGESGDSPSLGLQAVLQHARQLTHMPARESTERFGRERLLAAAGQRARAPKGAANPFAGRGVWARLSERVARWTHSHEIAGFRAWGALAAAACLATLGYLGYSELASDGSKAARSLPLTAATHSHDAQHSKDQPLTYTTSGGQPSASNYLVAPAHDSASLRFSDGTEVTAAPGSRLRVDSTQSNGARVLLEQGEARANVTHRDDTRWMFVAGPFDVRITGTTFTLSWDAADQVLDLTLHEGSVEVESPLGASHLKVKTGQRFHASVTDGTMQLLAADGTAPATRIGTGSEAEASDAVEADEPAQAKPSARSRARSARAAALAALAQRRAARAERRAARHSEREEESDSAASLQLAAASYADLVRAGAFEQVVNAATKAGLAQTLERNSAEDVRALADAARYLHRTELAVRSLTVLRARFPGSHHSAAAAFLLGRTYENAEQAQAARRFYELYERESPNGEFAAEALAGRMRIIASVDGKDASRAIAQQYLDRYPRGVHAKTARQLLH